MSEHKTSDGIGFFGILQIVLITLRLAKVINWHWAIVLLPIEIEVVLFLLVLVLWMIVKMK